MRRTGKAGSLAAAICILLAGCGSSSSGTMSAKEYQSKGNAICAKSLKQLKALGQPNSERQFIEYLPKAVAISEGEVAQLSGLSAPSSNKASFHAAISGATRATSILAEFSKKLTEKQVKLSAFSTIQKQVGSLGAQINANFTKAGLPECAREQ